MLLGHDKVNFLGGATPLTRLDRLSEALGIDLWLKRDDMTPFGTGGNKLRKLEYLLKDAQDQGATMLLTTGGAQTNHGRLTAAVAAKYGMRCAIVAVDEYPGEISANLLLDGIMDCHVYLVKQDGVHTSGELAKAAFADVTAEWEAKGEKVYFIPVGGSNEIGALGYYDCALELAAQAKELGIEEPRIVTTVGSMGTYIGLLSAQLNEGLPFGLTGVTIMPYENVAESALSYYGRVKDFYGLSYEATEDDLSIVTDFDCGAYNNPVKEVRDAIRCMGSSEGILLDPCYTGKTFAAILGMVKDGRIRQGESVIMLHTGGIPGLYTKHHRIEFEKELMDHIHII